MSPPSPGPAEGFLLFKASLGVKPCEAARDNLDRNSQRTQMIFMSLVQTLTFYLKVAIGPIMVCPPKTFGIKGLNSIETSLCPSVTTKMSPNNSFHPHIFLPKKDSTSSLLWLLLLTADANLGNFKHFYKRKKS